MRASSASDLLDIKEPGEARRLSRSMERLAPGARLLLHLLAPAESPERARSHSCDLLDPEERSPSPIGFLHSLSEPGAKVERWGGVVVGAGVVLVESRRAWSVR